VEEADDIKEEGDDNKEEGDVEEGEKEVNLEVPEGGHGADTDLEGKDEEKCYTNESSDRTEAKRDESKKSKKRKRKTTKSEDVPA